MWQTDTKMAKHSLNDTDQNEFQYALSPQQIRALHKRLLDWYQTNKRDLPWRKNPTPYRVWISEIMLQQTQVATVIPYYRRFLTAFPTVKALASADEHDVLKLWEGLGYYRRARQLRAAAERIVEHHRGRFPKTYEDVLALPGIGRYTAGAVLSIALGQKLPILEGNTIRLFTRLLAFDVDAKSSNGQNALWQFCDSILPDQSVSDFNQALMELGATICSPKNAQCNRCPLTKICAAYQLGNVDSYPITASRMQSTKVNDAAIFIERSGKVLVRQCQPGEVWAGLWDFPRFRIPHLQNSDRLTWLQQQVRTVTGLSVAIGEPEMTVKHSVTRP